MKSQIKTKVITSPRIAVYLFGFLVLIQACTPNARIMESAENSSPQSNATEVQVPSYESDVQAMRNADFTFILAFRRKDGMVLDADDKRFANANTPLETNRRKLTDNGKAILIGTNFPLPDVLYEQLADRFNVENLSKPESGPPMFKEDKK